MRILRRILLGFVVLIAAIAIIAFAGGYLFLRRGFPTIDGTLQIAGLQDRVEVYRDRWGVPHISAQNVHDLFFAQGYVTAQDRLWQMEFSRRIGHGRLSEVLGDATLDTDRFIRTLGWHRTAEMEVQNLDPESRVILEAYAAGVNAFIESHRDRLPLEFTILGYQPDPWTLVDSLVWGKVMAWNAGDNWEYELLRARLIQALGEERAAVLTPSYPSGQPLIIPPQADGYRGWHLVGLWSSAQGVVRITGLESGVELGSNNWVVDGVLSASGHPLLANDPHLEIQMPSLWYEVHLVGGGFNVEGSSLPGVPGVLIGHNERIAWGLTFSHGDLQDLYLERINSTNPKQYEYQGQWLDMEIVAEEILVKGQEPVVQEVRITRHGSLLSDVDEGLREVQGGTQAVAMRWAALEPSQVVRGILTLNQARNFVEFQEALSYLVVPSLNVVYADVEGNIGYQLTGSIPIRSPQHTGLVPVPGWTGEYEWQGYIPFEELPSLFNPPNHFVATANNRVVDDDYPYVIAYGWEPGFRAQRIIDLLTSQEQFTTMDFQRMQADDYLIPAETFLPYLLAQEPEGFLQERAMNELRKWDMGHSASSTGATIFQVFFLKLLENTFADELGEFLPEYLDSVDFPLMAMMEVMADPQNPWFDDVSTLEVETRAEIVRRSWEEALDFLGDRFGDIPTAWTWGRLHTATFEQITFGGIPPLSLIFNRGPFPTRGTDFVLNRTGYDLDEPFAVTTLPSYRQVIDLGDLANSWSMHTTGQSGIPFHPHYADMIGPWERVEYHPMLWEREDIEAQREGLLILEPAQ